MNTSIRLDEYFNRISYTGPREPDYDTLQSITGCHSGTITFENLDPFMGRPVFLNPELLQDKLVRSRRGGYCFEQNSLLRYVLEALGFKVTNLSARVLWGQEADQPLMPRTHMLLIVEIEDKDYLVDVGFGVMTPTVPLALNSQQPRETPLETFRLQQNDGLFLLQANLDNSWRNLYQFDLQPQLPVDYEVSNWYVSTHPDSRFVNSLILTMPGKDCRHTLQNNILTTHHISGEKDRKTLTSVDALLDCLQHTFGLQLPATLDLDRLSGLTGSRM